MKNGIYEATFTTSIGTWGSAVMLIRNGSFVGADGLQFYRGKIDQTLDDLRVIMEVTRHNFSTESAFGNESMFTLNWRGKAIDESTFKMECDGKEPPLTIYVTAALLKEKG